MTQLRRASVTVLLLATVALGAAACAQPIRKVVADPSRYRDRSVTISGRVIDSYSLVGRGAYHVDDGTGRLWVISDKGVPRTGADVKTKGTIKEAINLGALGNLVKLPSGGVVMIEQAHKIR